MNQVLKIMQTGLVVLFTLVNLYLMLFNWKVYTVSLEVDYGFGTMNAPIVLMVALIGLVTILLMWLVSYTKDLRYEVKVMKAVDEANRMINQGLSNINPEAGEVQLSQKIAHMEKQIEDMVNQKATSNGLERSEKE